MSRVAGASSMRGGHAEGTDSPSTEHASGWPERRPGYTRAELIKDLRCSRARELGLDATAAHVREKLMVFANADRETFVSVATLAGAIGRSEKTVRRALSRLSAAGEIIAHIEVTGWGRRNVYKLTGPGPVSAGEARKIHACRRRGGGGASSRPRTR